MTDTAPQWQPGIPVATLTALASLRQRIRTYFAAAGVTEVQTPCLGRHTVTDPAIESLSVELGAPDGLRYLQTSPEYYMKRLLAAGAPDIYQMGPVFRAGEAGRRHQPEFTLVEWYRHTFDYAAIIVDTVQLVRTASGRDWPVRQLSYRDAFGHALGIDPLTTSTDALATRLGQDAPDIALERDAILDWLFVRHVAPGFADDQLTVLTHYPASQAALARLDDDDPRTAQRFEVFAGTLELGNGFVELTDADEQARRFATDRAQRKRRQQAAPAADPLLLAALAHGLPACAGVAVGFERLAMLCVGVDDIADVLAFTSVTAR